MLAMPTMRVLSLVLSLFWTKANVLPIALSHLHCDGSSSCVRIVCESRE